MALEGLSSQAIFYRYNVHKRAFIIGLTGGIASGKSCAADILREKGAAIVDADVVSRELVYPGSPLLEKLEEAFGSDIILADGNLDRARLASLAFADDISLETINSIMHPAIWKEIFRQIDKAAENARVVVLAAPLLLEHGAEAIVDSVWVTDVTPEIQLERLIARDKLNNDEAQRRIAAQMPLDKKAALADVLLDNNGNKENLRAQIEIEWEEHVEPIIAEI
ncbi:MAG: dephospho-CoA kinase [bacterium]|nr:dephospho-CoA kinase [bacterium]